MVAAGSQAQLDQINVMCYDLDWGLRYSWYLDPLLQNGNPNALTCDWDVGQFTSAGVAPGKIGVGILFTAGGGRERPRRCRIRISKTPSPSHIEIW